MVTIVEKPRRTTKLSGPRRRRGASKGNAPKNSYAISGKKLAAQRERRGLLQYELAHLIGMSVSGVARIESMHRTGMMKGKFHNLCREWDLSHDAMMALLKPDDISDVGSVRGG
jgi:DNA-binding XRE family transcriptional regulator